MIKKISGTLMAKLIENVRKWMLYKVNKAVY